MVLGKIVGDGFQDRELAVDGVAVQRATGDLEVFALTVLVRHEIHPSFAQLYDVDLVASSLGDGRRKIR